MTTSPLADPGGTTADVPGASCCPPVTEAVDRQTALELAGALKALADPTRLQIISMLATSVAGEICSCDFPAALDRSQSTTSHHLSQLTAAGFLEREQRGKWAWFRLRHDRLAEVSRALGA